MLFAHATHDSLTIKEARSLAQKALLDSTLNLSLDVAQLEADLLLLKSFDHEECPLKETKTRTLLYAQSSQVLDVLSIGRYENLLLERIEGLPIAYLLGSKEFFAYEFLVNEHTLIPRSETEQLVEEAIAAIQGVNDYSDPSKVFPVIFDIGLGTGAILISVIKEIEKKGVSAYFALGSDVSRGALEIAQKNLEIHGISRSVHLVQSSLLSSFDLAIFQHYLKLSPDDERQNPLFILSNPPYIPFGDPKVETNVERYEPSTALFSPDFGMFHSKAIIDNFLNICSYWKSDVHLILEIGVDQSNELESYAFKQAENLFNSNGSKLDFSCEARRDLRGIPRILHFSS